MHLCLRMKDPLFHEILGISETNGDFCWLLNSKRYTTQYIMYAVKKVNVTVSILRPDSIFTVCSWDVN